MFPFGATSIFLARLINVVGIVIWAEASRRFLTYILNPLLAACGALAMALTPLALEMGGQVKADIVFGAIVMVTIAVAIGHPAKESTRQAVVRGVVIGLLGAAAMLVRTIGFTLLFGIR